MREDDIYDNLEKIQGSSFGANVTSVADAIAADGNAGAIRVGFFRADETDHFVVDDIFAMLLWGVLISDDFVCTSAFDTLSGLGGVGANTLAEAAKFIGVGAVPDVFVGRILTELVMFLGFTSGGVQDREGPVGDKVGWVFADFS